MKIIARSSGRQGLGCGEVLAKYPERVRRDDTGRQGLVVTHHALIFGSGHARDLVSGDLGPEPEFERLTLNQRIQHWLLIVSFTTLLVSGLPLTSPTSAISRGVITFLGGMGARAVIHRAAAIGLVAICCYHLLYVLFSRRGHREFRQLIPGVQDAKDVVQMLKFYFGLTPVGARFGRYNFIEKFEYLSVGWGSVIMIGTGVLLWAPHLSLMFFPKWLMDVAFALHSWEAILAFLAIIVWHMYNVHFNPPVFPMSRVWLTGKIGLHELRENHPLE